ncbi:MAG TPA: hypothetical protein VEA38_16825 [Terriglobales bacterium]|nr:hypothetical protein [Terriglobales bacterium]
MGKALQLELSSTSAANGSTFKFDVEGEFLPRWEPSFKFSADPPQLTEMRRVWEFRQCRLVSSTTSGLWANSNDNIGTLDLIMGTRSTGRFTAATIKRDPDSANATVFQLGVGTGVEAFTVEFLEGETDALTPAASWRYSAAFTIRISQVTKLTDANGIVGWEQSVSYSYPNGLAQVEMRTRITTREGTSAVTKAQTYGKLDVANFGSAYTYDTNGTSGIDYLYTDADETNSRTPTVVECVSRVRQWGVNVGTTAGGTSPSEVGYTVATKITAKATEKTYTVSARGPGYLSWVTSRKPSGPLTEDELVDDQANKFATGTWTIKTDRASEDARRSEISVEITGGHPALDYEPVAGGYEPIEFNGALLPWQATLHVAVERTGGTGLASELPLPGILGAPWKLDRNASTEGEPYQPAEEKGTDKSQDTWRREARLVYRSARKPSGPVLAELREIPPINSYFLEAA